jgi:hypothetical protein
LRDKSRPIAAICGQCDLLPTKPGAILAHLAPLVMQAHRMESLFESGAGTEYPNFYTSLEWEAYLALKYARAKDQEKSLPKPDKKQTEKQLAQRKLEERMSRG